jgi:hypothetical protein
MVRRNLVKKKQHGCMITTLGLLLNYFLVVLLQVWWFFIAGNPII